MKKKDYLKFAFLLLFRDKNKKAYAFIICICCLMCIGILTYNAYSEDILLKSINNNIGFRTITVMPRNNDEELSKQENIQKDLEDILTINNVDDVYDSRYGEAIIFESDFSNNGLDGAITLKRANEKTLPTIVEGRKFNDNETGVIICPSSFFPNSDTLKVDKKLLINGSNILNTSFNVYYYDYKYDENKRKEKNERFESEFKIVGIYDTSERLEDNGVCYITANDIEKISTIQERIVNDISKPNENSTVSIDVDYGIQIVVDNVENVEDVILEVMNMGFEYVGTSSYIDENTTDSIRWLIIGVLFISILTSTVVTVLYIKKKLVRDEENIAILRTCGYTKKNVSIIYTIQSLVYNSIIFIIGSILFVLLFVILINYYPLLIGIDLMIGGLTIKILPILLTSLLIVVIPSAVTYYCVRNKCKIDIHNLIKNGE